MKIIISVIVLLIFASLASALFHLIRHDKKDPLKVVKALTMRISLSFGLFILLLMAFALGYIQPHGLPQIETKSSTPQ